MDKFWLALVMTTLSACSSTSYTPVVQAAVRPGDLSDMAATAEMTAFLANRGFVLRSSASQRGKPQGSEPTLHSYSDGDAILVTINNDSIENCFNFNTFVESQSNDTSGAKSIGQAFITHFQHAPGWKVTLDDGCRVAP